MPLREVRARRVGGETALKVLEPGAEEPGPAVQPELLLACIALAMEEEREALPIPLPPQPKPVDTLVVYFRVLALTITAIARRWANGDERRCKLCPVCKARGGICLIVARGLIPQSLAALFSVVSLRRQGRDGIGVLTPVVEGRE